MKSSEGTRRGLRDMARRVAAKVLRRLSWGGEALCT